MARLVRLRDGSCRFPGCPTPARQCDLDHVRAWPEGPTATRNRMALCRRHHRIKQRLDWRVSISPDATVTWWDPTGHEVTTRPVDHLHLVSARTEHSARAGALIRGLALLTTFEEQLHDLLDGDPRQLVRAGPHVWDADGTLLTGPPPKVDLESGHGPASTGLPEFTVALDHWPPSAPPGPDVIPF